MTGPENLYFMKFLRVIHRSSPIKVHHRRCPGGPIAKKKEMDSTLEEGMLL